MPKIKIENLTVKYINKKNETLALDDVSLSFSHNAFNTIVGESGSGKSTLLKTLAGLLDYQGEIYLDDKNFADLSLNELNVSYVSQEFVLYPYMNIFDNIAFPLKAIGASKEEIRNRVKEIAIKLDIEHCLSRKPKHLSIGQRQRAAIARALVKKPSIILLDEPFSNLDPTLREELCSLVKLLVSETSTTVIYVTHSLFEAIKISDTLTFIDDGKVAIFGNREEVLSSHNETVEVFLKTINYEKE